MKSWLSDASIRMGDAWFWHQAEARLLDFGLGMSLDAGRICDQGWGGEMSLAKRRPSRLCWGSV
jgi:hypothetical protein